MLLPVLQVVRTVQKDNILHPGQEVVQIVLPENMLQKQPHPVVQIVLPENILLQEQALVQNAPQVHIHQPAQLHAQIVLRANIQLPVQVLAQIAPQVNIQVLVQVHVQSALRENIMP